MAIDIKSSSDRTLLHLTGFFDTKVTPTGRIDQRVNLTKLAEFCGVSVRTARYWGYKGLPVRARIQLENLYNGEYLPAAWRRAGIRIVHDGAILPCGNHITVEIIALWRFIVCGVDWHRVRGIEDAVNAGRRIPAELVQPGLTAVSKLMIGAGVAGKLSEDI